MTATLRINLRRNLAELAKALRKAAPIKPPSTGSVLPKPPAGGPRAGVLK